MKKNVPDDLTELISGLDDELPLDDALLPMTRSGVVDYGRQTSTNSDNAELNALFSPTVMKSLTPQEERDVELTKMVAEMQLGVNEEGEFHSNPFSVKEQARARFQSQLSKLFGQMKQVFTPQRFDQEVKKIRTLLKTAMHEAALDNSTTAV